MVTTLKKTERLNIKKLTRNHKEFLLQAMEAIGSLIEISAKKKCAVDQGHLRDSIQHEVIDWDEVHVGTSQISYAAPVEFGAVPHAAPWEPIQEWAARHGIENWRGVWWKIYHHGTQPQPYMRPAIHENETNITELIRKACVQAARKSGRGMM